MIAFTALEFSLYEVILLATEQWTGKEMSLIGKLSQEFEFTRFTYQYVFYILDNNQISIGFEATEKLFKLFGEPEEKDLTKEIDREKEMILEIVKEEERHKRSDVIIAGVIAGALASFSTNSIELLTINKQTNPNFKVMKYIMQRKNWYNLLL